MMYDNAGPTYSVLNGKDLCAGVGPEACEGGRVFEEYGPSAQDCVDANLSLQECCSCY